MTKCKYFSNKHLRNSTQFGKILKVNEAKPTSIVQKNRQDALTKEISDWVTNIITDSNDKSKTVWEIINQYKSGKIHPYKTLSH